VTLSDSELSLKHTILLSDLQLEIKKRTEKLARKPLYACGICGLYFTRSYNAERHSKNLHDNKADIVTFSEYMTGRMSGKYPPGNPSLYRIKNRKASKPSMSKPSIVHQYENDNNTHFNQQKYVLDCTKTSPICNSRDNTESVSNQFDIEKYVDNLLQPFNRARESRKKQEIEELINEIERMLYDFYPHEQVQAIVTEFKRRFNATTDYTALHTALDNYRTSLVDRALGRPTWSNTHTKLDP
jgi:hypothetical protein